MRTVKFCTVCRILAVRWCVVTVDLAPSLRERKKIATRRAIHAAAFELVERHGLAGVTVEVISDRAGVAPRTFWTYFSSKEDAVLDRDIERPDALRRALLARPADEDALTALRRVLEEDLAARAGEVDMHLRRWQLIRREPLLRAAVAAMFDEIERALVTGVAERLGRDPDVDLLPVVMVSAVIGAFRVAHVRWADMHGEVPVESLLDEAFYQLTHGLDSPELGAGR
jgi:AcrR family transcriptional regulator